MKNFEKVILWGAGLAFIGFLIKKGIKYYRQGMEELEKQEIKETEDLKNAGVDTSKLKQEFSDDDVDWAKMLFVATRFNSDFDLDLFAIESDPDNKVIGVAEVLDENAIRIRQKIIGTKHGGSRRYVDFIIDIPEECILDSGSYRNLTLGNYLTTFKKAAEDMNSIVKFSKPAVHKMFGSVVISRKKEGEEVIEYRQLRDTVYGQYKDDKHDGLSKFVQIEKTKLKHLGYDEYTKEAKWLFVNCPDLSEDDPTICINNIILQYFITFPIRSNKPGELFGIDIKTGIECIKYLTEEMVVERDKCPEKVTYRHLMFNAINTDGYSDLSWYYTVDENENVIDQLFVGFND